MNAIYLSSDFVKLLCPGRFKLSAFDSNAPLLAARMYPDAAKVYPAKGIAATHEIMTLVCA